MGVGPSVMPKAATVLIQRDTPLIAPIPENELQRIEALTRYEILDTDPEAPFDELVQLAAQICQMPIALISLVDSHRQWFKAKVGTRICETSRDVAFSAHAILQPDIFEVPDTTLDDRFVHNPLVTGEPHIRFYAGTPLRNSDGYAIGTVCVIDRVPRLLTPDQRHSFAALSCQVVNLLDLRLRNRQLKRTPVSPTQPDSIPTRCLFVFEHTPDGIAILDRAGRYIYMNRAHAALYGYDPAELIGKSWKELYASDWAIKIETVLFPLLTKENRWHGATIGKNKRGEDVSTEISLALFPEQDRRGDWLLWTCHNPRPQQADHALPAALPTHQPVSDQPKPSQPSLLSILLVEDMEDNQVLITLLLKTSPYRVDVADNGAVGVGKFQSGRYDLVLMDIQMPVMDGYEAVRTMRAWEAEQGRDAAPIIALTASAFKEDIEKAQAAGFTAHLAKPITKQSLLETIRHYATTTSGKEAA